jgi:DNA-binding CsgD family transcriptional regulator
VTATPAPAARPAPLRLRVAIDAADPVAASRLARLVAQSGHDAVAAHEPADAVVSDGSAKPVDMPVVAIGVEDGDFAGLLPQDAGPAQLDAALRAVAAGLMVRPFASSIPGFAALPEPPAIALTPREVEVLAALAAGLGNKAVARRLGISPHTVKFHVEQLFRKLGAATRAEAVAKGLRRQIVEF